MTHLVYHLFIFTYAFFIKVASYFHEKAKLWVVGRVSIFEEIERQITLIRKDKKRIIWVHCASLGEFEQGRPLIESIKQKHLETAIVLTFFSPSGYEIRKKYDMADAVFYLPIDSEKNARKFISAIRPSSAFFIKYEFWFNYLRELKRQNIPTYLVSGIFRKNHYFFKWYGQWFRKQLSCFTHFYLQNSTSEKLLNGIGYKNTTVSGDTRFDRVFEIAKNTKEIPLIKQFANNTKLLIAGSTWPEDEKLLSTLDSQRSNPEVSGQAFKLIIAPHEINEEHLQAIEKTFYKRNCIRFSKANETTISTFDVLIIDNIGMLSSLYQYGHIAYIGGGFGKGIHNILEAATFGIPVIFGSNYQKFSEAIELITEGGAFSVSTKDELNKITQRLGEQSNYATTARIAKEYIMKNKGATDKILASIQISN